MPSVAGIYVITDLSAGKAYLGSSEDLAARLKYHAWQLKNRRHPNRNLQQAADAGHEFAVLPLPIKDADVLVLEQQLLDEFIDKGVLYNIARDAVVPNRGIVQDREHVEKRRQAMLGFRHSPETLAKLSEIAKARGMPGEVIEASAVARRGKPLSPEHIEVVRRTSKERMTPEAREHLRQVNLGVPHSSEDIERMKTIKRQNSGRAVCVEGRRYGSVAEVAEVLGIDPGLARHRLNSSTERFAAWSYISS